MSFYTRSAASPPSAVSEDIGLHPNWAERIVTAVGISVAVLIVAAIAVVMGMA
jgi:hypothetical protein